MGFLYNPFTGDLDITGAAAAGGSEFIPYHTIVDGQALTVATRVNYVISETLKIEGTGSLVLEGTAILRVFD